MSSRTPIRSATGLPTGGRRRPAIRPANLGVHARAPTAATIDREQSRTDDRRAVLPFQFHFGRRKYTVAYERLETTVVRYA